MFSVFILLISFIPLSSAQEVLTQSRAQVKVVYEMSDSSRRSSVMSQMDLVLSFLEKSVFPKIPEEFKAASLNEVVIEINTEAARNALQSKQGMFVPIKRGEGRANYSLSIYLKESAFFSEQVFRLLTHEWFHALHFTIHPGEESWIQEGLAQWFETLVLEGYPGPQILAALDRSTTGLEHSFDLAKREPEAYGHSFTYFKYLIDRCGGVDLFWSLVKGDHLKRGRATIDNALSLLIVPRTQPEICSGFKESARAAEIARVHNHLVYEGLSRNQSYLVYPELTRTMQITEVGPKFNEALSRLKSFQPLVLQASDFKKVKSSSGGLSLYTLERSFPYTVHKGAKELKDAWILILKED